MNRRTYLSSIPLGVAGCTASRNASTDTATPSPDPVRCRGEPITATRTVSDDPEYDNLEYYPSNATVRLHQDRGPDPYLDVRFDKWASVEAASVGAERVHEVTSSRLGASDFGISQGNGPDSYSGDQQVIWVTLATRFEDGRVVSTPTTSVSQLADSAPSSAEVTLHLEDAEYSRTVPVFAKHVKIIPT